MNPLKFISEEIKEATKMNKFSIGDIVKLKCGGPPMTVSHIQGDGLLCRWFDTNHDVKQGVFLPEILEFTVAIPVPTV